MFVCFKHTVQFGIYVSNRIVLPSEGPFESPNLSQNRSPDGSGTVPGVSGGVQEGARGILERSLNQLEPDVPPGTLFGPFLEPSRSPSGPLLGHLELP